MVFFVGGGGEGWEELGYGGEEGVVLGFEVEVEEEMGEKVGGGGEDGDGKTVIRRGEELGEEGVGEGGGAE